MNTTNQIFNWSRFTKLLRKELAENWRSLAINAVAFYFVFTAFMILANYFSAGEGNNAQNPVLVFLFLGIIAALGFKQLHKKGTRISYLALPASTTEKFAVNTVVYVLGGLVLVTACMYLADFTRMAFLWHYRSESFIVFGPTAMPDTIIDYVDSTGTLGKCLPLWSLDGLFFMSLFMLGSVLWSRRSFGKTLIVILV